MSRPIVLTIYSVARQVEIGKALQAVDICHDDARATVGQHAYLSQLPERPASMHLTKTQNIGEILISERDFEAPGSLQADGPEAGEKLTDQVRQALSTRPLSDIGQRAAEVAFLGEERPPERSGDAGAVGEPVVDRRA